MTTEHVGATVIDLQARRRESRRRFDEAMQRHPAYLSRLSTPEPAELAFHAPISLISARQKQSRRKAYMRADASVSTPRSTS